MTTNAVPTWADPVALGGRAAGPVLELWQRLLRARPRAGTATDGPSTAPEAARLWLAHASAAGAAPAHVALLRMRGHIKVGRWLPFQAVQVIVPTDGFVWVARVGWGPLSITGFDCYDGLASDGRGAGRMRWSIGGRLRLVDATGPDLTRSAADRVALDAIWLPPSFGSVRWEPGDGPDSAFATRTVGDEDARVELRTDGDGRLTSVRMERWASPGKLPWGRHPCGGIVDAEATFDAMTIASRVRVGYGIGTDGWADGEFLRCEITDAAFLG